MAINFYFSSRSFSIFIIALSYFLIPLQSMAQGVTEQWAARYKAAAPTNDRAYRLAVDAKGNSYVTGTSIDSAQNQNIHTIKYSPSGEQLWVAVLKKTNTIPAGIVLDSAGGVYVAATGNGQAHLVKYNATDGAEVWAIDYQNAQPDFIALTDLATDNSGGIYLTGWAGKIGVEGSDDFITLRYNAATGAKVWESRYNGNDSGDEFTDDRANAIAVDNAGSVYVVGGSWGPGSIEHFATVRYDAATGKQVWDVRTSAGGGGFAAAGDVAVDNKGGVYVTGSSEKREGEEPTKDFATIRYDAATGNQTWLSRYDGGENFEDGPAALTVDENGGVYVTGSSIKEPYNFASADYATVRYDATTGAQTWTQRYDGPANGEDRATDIEVDNKGDVFVTGWSEGINSSFDYATIRYEASSGEQVWITRSGGIYEDRALDMAIDNDGVLYVAGWMLRTSSEASADYAIVLYDPVSGAENNKLSYDSGGDASDEATAMTVDKAGNVYVTGASWGIGNYDFATIKYSPQGQQLWVARFDGPAGDDDRAVDIEVDPSGNVYVTGNSRYDDLDVHISKYATIKYSANGQQQWVAYWGGLYDDASATALALDDASNIYVTGSNYNWNYEGGFSDIVTVKYSPTGEEQWVDFYDGPHRNPDGAADIKVDKNGSIYVAGTGDNGDPEEFINDFDFILIKYTAGGTREWIAREENYRTISNRLIAMALGVDGHIYLTGLTSKITEIVTDVDYNILYSDADYLTMKYDPEGKLVWEQRYNGTGHSTDIANSVAVDDAGNVYVAGRSDGDTLKNEVTIIKYNAEGEQLWVQRSGVAVDSYPLYYMGYSSENEGFLRLDTSSNIYITTSSNHKILTMKYDTSGNKIWQTQSEILSAPTAIALDEDNNLFVAGASLRELTSNEETYYQPEDYLTIKYNQGAVACNIPVQVKLYLPPYAVRVGEPVKTTAAFTNQVVTPADSVRWNWGDNSTSEAFARDTTRVTGKHAYQQAGIYKIGLDLSKSCLKATNEDYQQWMVIYDPAAGFVTGAGQINSPQGPYPLMSEATNAQFAFFVSYQSQNSTVPQGQTYYNISNQGNFRSRALTWLVIQDNLAIWKGEGSINGKGNYTFIASVTDAGGRNTNDIGDRFRIRIWNKDDGNAIVYDNFGEAGDIYNLTAAKPAIDRGQIIINRRGTLTDSLFTITQTQIQPAYQAHFYNYPNTFSHKTILSFAVQEEGDFELEVFDIKGQSVQKVSAGRAEKGQVYEYEFDGSQLEPGIYIARLTNGTSIQSIKLMLRR